MEEVGETPGETDAERRGYFYLQDSLSPTNSKKSGSSFIRVM